MNNRERTLAILNYQDYDRMPIVHFGFWEEVIWKWHEEGHVTRDEAENYRGDGSPAEKSIAKRLGFDYNWHTVVGAHTRLLPPFERKVIERLPDGFYKLQNENGVIILQRDGAGSIPAEVDHLFKGRKEWEELYRPRLQYSEERINAELFQKLAQEDDRENPLGLYCGSLFGQIRDMLGLEGVSYLYVDDEELYDEIIDTIGELSYKCLERVLSFGVKFDFAHFWEDIAAKNGPLIIPSVFESKVGPHYRRITKLLNEHGIDLVSVDCDGCIDALIPTWINNGVNTMFPIEVGTWNASILPWREKYGKELRGVGGMNKTVFSQDYAAVDKEIERLKPLVELGGYIPCPDHRIPLDAKWENVQYYCERMRETFSHA